MDFVAGVFAQWLLEQLADAGRKRLVDFLAGDEQERALRIAATVAIQLTAESFCPGDGPKAEHLGMVIDQVFREPVPRVMAAGQVTLLQALQSGIAAQLAPLADAELTGTGQSSLELLEMSGADLAQELAGHLVRQIVNRGSRGGPLASLANQLNHDVTHLQGQRVEAKVDQLARVVEEALAQHVHLLQASPDATAPWPGRPSQGLGAAEPVEVGWTGNNLPPRNPVFTGREKLLNEVGRRLAGGPVAVIAVDGLGGVGKSQIALEYAHRSLVEGKYRLAWWVRADSAVTIAEDLAALAPLIGIETVRQPGKITARVIARLSSQRGWLMVFDNAAKPGDLAGVLPGGIGHVLINSRNRGWSGLAARLNVEVFERWESVAFLRERTGLDEPEAANALAEGLGDLPLALAQAAAYIESYDLLVEQYLNLYRDPGLGRRLRATALETAEYPASVAGTWLLHFKQLRPKNPAAVELMRLCAFLDPDDINLRILGIETGKAGRVLADAMADPLTWVETTGVLVRSNLLTRKGDGTAPLPDATEQDWRELFNLSLEELFEEQGITDDQRFRVHRLVQSVIRDQLDDQAEAWAARALELLIAAFPERSWRIEHLAKCERLGAHVIAAVECAKTYPKQAVRCGELLKRLGIYLASRRRTTAAVAVLERALALKEAAYGADHPELVRILTNLGALQREMGDLDASRATFARAVAFKAANGLDHLAEAAEALAATGSFEQRLGELECARATLDRAVALKETTLGPGDPEVALTLERLSSLQQEMGDLEGARISMERAVAIFEAALGVGHPAVAETLRSLSTLQQEMGDLEGARTTLERALAIFEAALGADAPDVLLTLGRLGILQREMGNLDSARTSLERALAVALYQPNSPEVAAILGNLVHVQLQLGDLQAPEDAMEGVLGIYEFAGTELDSQTEIGTIFANLGHVQQELGDLNAARATLERAIATIEGAHESDVLPKIAAMANLGHVQQELGDLNAARATLVRALANFGAKFGPNKPEMLRSIGVAQIAISANPSDELDMAREVAETLANLGSLQRKLGDLDDARATLKYAILIQEAGTWHPFARKIRLLLEELP